jgi:hypothetical protein
LIYQLICQQQIGVHFLRFQHNWPPQLLFNYVCFDSGKRSFIFRRVLKIWNKPTNKQTNERTNKPTNIIDYIDCVRLSLRGLINWPLTRSSESIEVLRTLFVCFLVC